MLRAILKKGHRRSGLDSDKEAAQPKRKTQTKYALARRMPRCSFRFRDGAVRSRPRVNELRTGTHRSGIRGHSLPCARNWHRPPEGMRLSRGFGRPDFVGMEKALCGAYGHSQPPLLRTRT